MSRIPAYLVVTAMLALPAGCPGDTSDNPTPFPSVVCDSNPNGLVWCKQPAPSPAPSEVQQ